MKPLTYALIGCGRISKNHIDAVIAHSSSFLPVAMVDPIAERAQAHINRLKSELQLESVTLYTDYKKMLEEVKPDVVAVATESGYHAAITLDAIHSGCHVIVEKPMALSSSDCHKIIGASRKLHKKVAVCFQNRFNPPVIKLADAIKDNKFGRIHHGQISVRWNRNEEYFRQADWRFTWDLDGGALMNQCSHGIDLLQWAMGGKIQSVYGVLRKYKSPREGEDFGSAIIEFDNGAVGIVEGTVTVYPRNLEEKLSIFGEKGTAVIGGVAVNHLETWSFEGENLSEERTDPPNVYGFGHTALYQDFFESIRDNRKPLVSAEDGRIAVDLILAIYQSMKTGQKVEFPVDFSSSEMKGIRLNHE